MFQTIIGKSVQGRKIFVQSNTDLHKHSFRPHALLVAGIHGDERAPVHILEHFTAIYLKPGTIPWPICVVTILNPDGFAGFTRENARDVDLNRNFPSIHGGNNREKTGFCPLSEPESRALNDFITTYQPARIISLHWALSEIDADGEQSYDLARSMQGALSARDKKLYRLKLGRADTEDAKELSGSLGQWCGYGLQYPGGKRPVMITLELPYTFQTRPYPHPLPEDSWQRVNMLWRKNRREYLRRLEPGVHRLLSLACQATPPRKSQDRPARQTREFLKTGSQFRLGKLSTEKPHPRTRRLSQTVRKNPAQAIETLKAIDLSALRILERKAPLLRELHLEIKRTLRKGGDIFLAGCGATGRLCLSLEFLWRQQHKRNPLKHRVTGFMSGGDVAMIRSIEHFEDHADYGARQLKELGFSSNDLLVGCTEGGETPYVIGAVEAAAEMSTRKPFFIYGNPDRLLCKTARRSKRIIQDSRYRKINLDSGPMAIAGSTRMQSSTLIMAGVGMALQYFECPFREIVWEIGELRRSYQSLDITFLDRFIEYESSVYNKSEYLLYHTNRRLAITLLTDTTERAPTFSLPPFENTLDPAPYLSQCYLYLPEADTPAKAWRMVFGRKPRTLTWPNDGLETNYSRLLGFDFSRQLSQRRLKGTLKRKHHVFRVNSSSREICFNLGTLQASIPVRHLPLLQQHLILKMVINIHSTLVMGLLGRFHGNLMTWVHPTNNKLIDRAARYLQILASEKQIKLPYKNAVYEIFRSLQRNSTRNSAVVRALNRLRRNRGET